MTRFVCVLIPMIAGLLPPTTDVCTEFGSFCMESGICSNSTLPCSIVYKNLPPSLNRTREIPIIKLLSEDAIQYGIRVSRGATSPLTVHANRPGEIDNFDRALADFSTLTQTNFPYIRYIPEHSRVFATLAQACLNLRRNPQYNNLVARLLLDSKHMADIRETLRQIIEYISFMERDESTRNAIFANSIPFVHTWSLVHKLLSLSPPLVAPEYLDYLTAATRYDPMWDLPPLFKQWDIYISGLNSPLTSKTTLPIVNPSDDDYELPLAVYDFFNFSPSDHLNTTETVETILSNLNQTSILYQYMAVLFVSYHPDMPLSDQQKFCDSYYNKTNYTLPIRSATVPPDFELKMMSTVLDLYRLCPELMPLTVRIEKLLPLLLRRRSWINTNRYHVSNESTESNLHDMMHIPISILRSKFRISHPDGLFHGFPDLVSGHVAFLSDFIDTYDAIEVQRWIMSDHALDHLTQDKLHALGVAVALLFVEGDPSGIIRQKYPQLMLMSNSYRRGFCKVINCFAFETLFHRTEIPTILDSFARTSSLPPIVGTA